MMDDLQDDKFRGTDRFEVRRRIGAGGMGVVYLAYDRQRAEFVAIKTLRHIAPDAIYRLKREFRSMAELSHSQLVKLHELFCAEQQWFFTMEYIDGVNLLEYLQHDRCEMLADQDGADQDGVGSRYHISDQPSRDSGPKPVPKGGSPAHRSSPDSGVDSARHDDRARAGSAPLEIDSPKGDWIPPPPSSASHSQHGRAASRSAITLDQVARIRHVFARLAAGVYQLHSAGRLHRDLKPTNVLLTSQGRLVILDFGLATDLETDEQCSTTEGLLVGTAPYMSPEQAMGRELTPASDWYSVGVILYEALTGRTPFIGRPLQILTDKQRIDPPRPSDIVDGVPKDLDALCIELLSRDPRFRPASREVASRLGAATTSLHPSCQPTVASDSLFVGQEGPLQQLFKAHEHIQRGQTVVVSVTGEPGVGKSALVRHFINQVRTNADTVILNGRCHESERVPYNAIDSLIDALSHHLSRLSALEVEALAPRDIEPLMRIFPVLERVESLTMLRTGRREPLDKQELRERAFTALRELLDRLAVRSTLVLHIDNFQWTDADSITLLKTLLRSPDAPQLLLIVCQRTETSEDASILELRSTAQDGDSIDMRQVALNPLTISESHKLALGLWAAPTKPTESLISSIAANAAGSPYFLALLVRYYSNMPTVETECPPTAARSLERILTEQIAMLDDSAQRLLQVLSVAGHPVRLLIAQRAASLTDDASGAITSLRAAQLIRVPGTAGAPALEIYHSRIRDTVLAQLPPGDQRRLHHRLAEAMEAAEGMDAATVASHFVAADEPGKGRAYFLEAASQASGALAFDRAAELYRQACELGVMDELEQRQLLQKRAHALANAGRGSDAGQIFEQAAAGAPAEAAVELHRLAAMQYLFSGQIDPGLTRLKSVLLDTHMRLPSGPRRALARWLWQRAILRTRGSNFKPADESAVPPKLLKRIDACWSATVGLSIIDPISAAVFQTRGLLLALRSGEPSRIARALCLEAAHMSTLGGSAREKVDMLLDRASTIAFRCDTSYLRGLIRLATGIALLHQGQWRAARQLCDEANQMFRDECTGAAWETDCAAACAATALLDAGDVKELTRRLPPLRARARERGNLFALTAPSSMNLPSLAADEPDTARQILDACMQHWPGRRFYAQHLSALYDRVQTDLYDGNAAAAWSRIANNQSTVAHSLLTRVQLSRAFAFQTRARCALAMIPQAANPQRMLRVAEHDAKQVKREGQDWTLPLAELLLAAVAASRHQLPAAADLLEKAVVHFDKVGMVLYAAVARHQLGKLIGEPAGNRFVATAQHWMSEQDIVNPDRFCRLFAPGIPADPSLRT